jgi:sulfur carrier protein
MKTNKIQLNGKTVSIEDGTTIGDLIREKGLDPGTVVVEHNRIIIDTTDLDRIAPAQHDVLEMLTFVGGG